MSQAEPDRVAAVAHVTDHVARGRALLMRALGNKPLLTALLAAYTAQVQAAEDALWALFTDTLETATGASLDQLGGVLLVARGVLDDEDYRVVLRAAVLARKSNGRARDVCAVLRAMLGPGPAFTYAEGHAMILLEPAGALPFSAAAAVVPLRLAKAGGVLLELIDTGAGPDWFAFAPGLVPVADAAQGLGDATDPDVGGPLVGVVT